MCYFIIEGTLAQERVQLHNIRQDLERRHQALICHLTTLDATILGILAVFLDKQQTSLFPLSPTVVGTSLLFLSLVSGIYYICMIHRQAVKVYRIFAQKLKECLILTSQPQTAHSAQNLLPYFAQ